MAKTVKRRIVLLNTMICFCLGSAIYLVMSVCITIPYLNEMRKPSAATQRALDSTLAVMSKTDTVHAKPIPVVPALADFSKGWLLKDSVMKVGFAALDFQQQQVVLGALNIFQSESKSVLESRADAVTKINDFYQNYKSNNSRIKDDLSRSYQANINNIAIDKNALYKDLCDAFENYLTQNSQSYTQALADMSRQDGYNSNANDQAIGVVRGMLEALPKNNATAITAYNSGASQVSFQPYPIIVGNNAISSIDTGYERNGSDWGILGWTAGYLIKTKSLDLVLLVGMIGFGILGASILSFTQMNDFFASFGHQALIKNFPDVLARGFGAALIIYLATKGGLAIFSMGNTQDPNGYILLLTCFIGAVFSQKVWNKVSTYLGS